MAADDIRAMSDALAVDPSSLVFLPLAEALLARGEFSHAERVAQRGAERGAARHAARADAYDLVARIALAQGDEDRAAAAWETVLQLVPAFGTAHRGLGFIMYRRGWLTEALGHLEQASADDPEDAGVQAAIDAVRAAMARALGAEGGDAGDASAQAEAAPPARPTSAAPASPDTLFDEILGDTTQVALLLEADGVVVAGRYHTADGTDLGAVIGAHLSGVSDEAERAMRHFGLGKWTRIVLETEVAVIAMAPVGTPVTLVAAPRDIPLGFVRRTLDRCSATARHWLAAWEAP